MTIEQPSEPTKSSRSREEPKEIPPRIKATIHSFVSVFCVLIYLIPIRSSKAPVLDELHIFDTRGDKLLDNPNTLNNADVMGTSNLSDLFQNDFWGKNIFEKDSHKSWRPLTILSFRYFNSLSESEAGLFRGLEDVLSVNTMFVHRLVSIIIHTLLSDLVAIAGVVLFPPSQTPYHQVLQFCLTKLLFALHPTHVETVVNTANRGHLLGLLASVFCSFGLYLNSNVVIVASIAGLLSSETFVFQLPAIIISIALLWFRKDISGRIIKRELVIKSALHDFLPQIIIPITFTFLYLFLRYYFGTLSIIEELIQKAENPFYRFEGWKRVINFSYVVAVHISKGIGIDPIGFSHEYGFNCVPEIESIYDVRLLLPLFIVISIVIFLELAYRKTRYNDYDWAVKSIFGLSWLITLFPISGIIRTGVFIGDRMVVPFTFAVTIIAGNMISEWILPSRSEMIHTETPRQKTKVMEKLLKVSLCLIWMSVRIHRRSGQWMSSPSLFESSLRTCPRYAKANLQLSKVYSGTIPGMTDYEKSLRYVTEAEDIDPGYCEVNYQFALIYFHQQKYTEFEQRLAKAMTCMRSIGQAQTLWVQYWPIVTDPRLGEAGIEATRRRDKFVTFIQDFFKEMQTKEEYSTMDKTSGSEFEL